MRVKIGVSARHIHISKEDLNTLFGEEYELKVLKNLSQGMEFASDDTLTIKTNKGQIDNVRIIGPVRDYTQVEISKTDVYLLGLNPPIRDSGDILGSEPITLVKGNNELYKPYGCIIANRHIHANEEELLKYNLIPDKKVKVRIRGEKGGVLDNVTFKVEVGFNLELHIDLDDANAHFINNGDEGEILID